MSLSSRRATHANDQPLSRSLAASCLNRSLPRCLRPHATTMSTSSGVSLGAVRFGAAAAAAAATASPPSDDEAAIATAASSSSSSASESEGLGGGVSRRPASNKESVAYLKSKASEKEAIVDDVGATYISRSLVLDTRTANTHRERATKTLHVCMYGATACCASSTMDHDRRQQQVEDGQSTSRVDG